jgi:carboxyl-terminal processing protease
LDLRSNPGGLVDEAAEVADEFLSDGTIYTARHRGQITDEVKAHGGGSFANVPTVVLVNEWSASASELVSGALQDHQRATIVGTNTFGKGSVQTILELPGGAGIRLTTARYYTPSGHAIQADGVHPDVLIDNSRITKSTLPVIRERDLENALSPEGAMPRDAGAVYVAPPIDADAGVTDESTAVRNVPTDPRKGSDFTLRVGYEVLVRK